MRYRRFKLTSSSSKDNPGHTLLGVVLENYEERLQGLKGHTREWAGRLVAFPHCCSVHTFGLREPIDIAFVSEAGRVLRSEVNVPPRRLLVCPNAFWTFERARSDEPWLDSGDHIQAEETVIAFPGIFRRTAVKTAALLTGPPQTPVSLSVPQPRKEPS